MRPDLHVGPEVVEWLSVQPAPRTYSELYAAFVERFGPELLKDIDQLKALWISMRRQAGRPFEVARDPAVLAFLRERVGLLPGPAMIAAMHAAFPDKTLPSKSSVYRWYAAERARLLGEDARALVAKKRRAASKRPAR